MEENSRLTEEETVQQQSVVQNPNNMLKEEVTWRQRSRVYWLKERGLQFILFHKITNGTRRINTIVSIQSKKTVSRKLNWLFFESYKSIFGQKVDHRVQLDCHKLISCGALGC